MARLPEIQPRGAVTRGPQSSLSGAEIANPFQQIANGLDAWSETLERKDVADSQDSGANAVYRDPDGTLRVDSRSNLSASGRAYNAAAQQGYTARLAGDIRTKGVELTNAAKGNIDTFNSGWKAFRDQTLTAVPKEFRGAVTTMLDSEGPRFSLGVSEQKRTSDLKEFEGNIKSQIQLLDDDASALARGGGVGTTAYREKQAQIKTLYQSLADNPDFNVGQDEANIALKRMEGRHMSDAMLGQVDIALNSPAGLAKARELANAITTDTSISLSPQERRQYAGLANERINGYVAQVKANLKPTQDQSTVIQKRLKEGVGLDNDDIDTTARTLAAGGDLSGAMELYQARAVAKTLQGFRVSDNPQQLAMAENALKSADAGNVGGGVVEKIVHVESGGNDNAQNPTSSAGGAGQFIDSTWLSMVRKYRPDVAAGKSAEELIALKKDGNLSREMTGRYAEENATFLRNQGIQTTDGNVYLAHFLGPRGAAQVLKADPNASVASIIGQDAVNANSFLQGKTVADLQAWADKKMGGSGVTSPSVDPEVIKEYRSEITSDARDLFTGIKAGFDKGLTPAVSDINLLSRQLALVDDQDFRKQVSDYFSSQSAIQSIGNAAPAQVESLIASLQADAGDGATLAQQQILTGLQDAQKAQAQALKDDPIGYAARKGMVAAPQALDLSNPDSWGTTFKGLQNSVDVLASRGMVGNISALRPEMQAQVARALTNSTPQDSVQLLGSMAQNLSPETYKATLGALYASGQARSVAAAGALVPDNPEAAEGVLRGQQLLKENPLLAPKKTEDNSASIDDLLPPTAFAPALEGARQTLLDAATARYADLSNQVGDTSGDLNDDRMQQAIQEVTGGILDMNGAYVVAPKYGMSQDDFDKTLGALGDADLAGAVTSNGTSVKASDLRNEGRLRAVADGRYVLEFGTADAPTYALRQPSPGSYGQPSVFVLDLRGR
ncbi:lysozyme family protein [Rhizobium leguminosarum]|uniref:hypothetical protein n=1 Tax=Rhizobium leguminosarum TaxID=384 RepID=UPI001609738A|nr:hypothetical protein [Rhizobium leguminosarum]MBB4342152.1 hypothetical protein [Rhizobium leguminosarum]MBB6294776.1 hypothetical protein [Rhizobium leguminosarum]